MRRQFGPAGKRTPQQLNHILNVLSADIRIAIHGKYVIVYRVRGKTAQILRVVPGARDVDASFADESLPK